MKKDIEKPETCRTGKTGFTMTNKASALMIDFTDTLIRTTIGATA